MKKAQGAAWAPCGCGTPGCTDIPELTAEELRRARPMMDVKKVMEVIWQATESVDVIETALKSAPQALHDSDKTKCQWCRALAELNQVAFALGASVGMVTRLGITQVSEAPKMAPMTEPSDPATDGPSET